MGFLDLFSDWVLWIIHNRSKPLYKRKKAKKIAHSGTWTHNLLLRRQMPYPIGPCELVKNRELSGYMKAISIWRVKISSPLIICVPFVMSCLKHWYLSNTSAGEMHLSFTSLLLLLFACVFLCTCNLKEKSSNWYYSSSISLFGFVGLSLYWKCKIHSDQSVFKGK